MIQQKVQKKKTISTKFLNHILNLDTTGAAIDSLSLTNNDISPPTSAGISIPPTTTNPWIPPATTTVVRMQFL